MVPSLYHIPTKFQLHPFLVILGPKENLPYNFPYVIVPEQSHNHSQDCEDIINMAMVDSCWLRIFSQLRVTTHVC